MDKNTIRLTYGLGIILGVCLSLVVLIFAYKNGVFHLEDNTRVLSEQNRKLEIELAEKNAQIDEMLNKNSKKTENIPDKKGGKVVVQIKQEMTNEQIANIIVKNGIYKHKNDLMMLLEMLNFNRLKYANILEENGAISSSYSLNNELSQLENNQYISAEYLYNKKMIQDKASFMKIVYLMSPSVSIKYGKKEFVKDSSLREIGDVLIN